MTPTISKIDNALVPLGDLQQFSIGTTAMPIDVGDTSGSITTFNSTFDVDHNDHEYAIGQQVTLDVPGAGKHVGKVVGSSKSENSNKLTIDAETFQTRLTVDKRCYPIYDHIMTPSWQVASAVDHWTQQCGLFYDKVPGSVITYHSFHGNFYGWSNDPSVQPRWSYSDLNGISQPFNYYSLGNRLAFNLGSGYYLRLLDSKVDLNKSKLAYRTPVPTSLENRQLAMSVGTVVNGDLYFHTDWYFYVEGATSPSAVLKLTANKTTGFSVTLDNYTNGSLSGSLVLFTSTTTALTAGNRIRAYIGVSELDATRSTFHMNIVDETANTLLRSVSTTAATSLRGKNLRVGKTEIHTDAPYTPGGGQPYDNTPWKLYAHFVTLIDGDLPTAALAEQKSLANTAKPNYIVPGFSGKVWDNLKQLMAIHRMDLWYQDDKLQMGQREDTPRVPTNFSPGSVKVSMRNEARSIEVTNQNSVASIPGSVPQVFFKADQVYQVDTGETQEIVVQTNHSIDTLNQPTCMGTQGITPYPYTGGGGQYVITGSDGYIVAPAFWSDMGGKITVETTDKEGEIKIILKGPDYFSVRAPYRVSEGDAGRPALYITGSGVVNKPEKLTIPTGNPTASDDVGETVDSPFICTAELAYDVAAQVSLKYASPQIEFTANEFRQGIEDTLAFGSKPSGALVRHKGNVYRVKQATQTHSSVQLSSTDQYNTIKQINDSFAGATIGEMNDYYAGKTIKDIAVKPLRQPIENEFVVYPSDTTYPSNTLYPGGN